MRHFEPLREFKENQIILKAALHEYSTIQRDCDVHAQVYTERVSHSQLSNPVENFAYRKIKLEILIDELKKKNISWTFCFIMMIGYSSNWSRLTSSIMNLFHLSCSKLVLHEGLLRSRKRR